MHRHIILIDSVFFQTLYGHDRQNEREKVSTTLPQKFKPGPSKSLTNKSVDEKVKTKNSEAFLSPPFSEIGSDEDVKQELKTVDINEYGALPCSTTNEGVKKQKNKRSMKALAQNGKKRKLQNHVEEETSYITYDNISTLLQKTKSRPSKPSVCRKEKTDNTYYKSTEEFPKALISEMESEESMKEYHVAGEETLLCNQRNVEDVGKKGGKRKSVEAVVQKVKKRKTQNNKEKEETSTALTNRMEKITRNIMHKTLEKKCKKISNTETGRNAACTYLGQVARSLSEPSCASGIIPETEDLPESMMNKEDLRNKIRKNSCMFKEVSGYPFDAKSLEALNQQKRRAILRKQKLIKKRQLIRKECMTFVVTQLETKQKFENIDYKEVAVNEISEMEAVNNILTGKPNTNKLKSVDTDSHKEIDWNNASSTEYNTLQNLCGNRCDTGSDDRSDSNDNNLESNKTKIVLENVISCRKEEDNLSKVDNTEDHHAAQKCDNKQEDTLESRIADSDESDRRNVVEAKGNTSHTAENYPHICHKEHKFDSVVLDSDTDDSIEELEVECKNNKNDVAVDGVSSNENRDNEVIVENGSNEMNGECGNMLGTSNKSNIFSKVNDKIQVQNVSEKFVKSCDNSKAYENNDKSNSEDEIISARCMVEKLHNKDVETGSSIKDTDDLNTNDQTENNKDSMGAADEVEVIEHNKQLNVDIIEDSKISNSVHAVLVHDSGYKTKVISKTNQVPNYNICDDDCDILEVPDSDLDIISSKESDKISAAKDIKNYLDLKEEPIVRKEVKWERKIKTTPIDVKYTNRTTLSLHHECSEHKKDASLDLVSKMMNNLYKSNVVKIEDEQQQRGNNQMENSKILNSQQNDNLKEFKDTPASTTNDNDESVVIVDDNEGIESMLQNIVKDTGRVASIHGLRERLFNQTTEKEERKENSNHEKNYQEPIEDSEISPSFVSQVKPLGSVCHESLGSTGDVNDKSVEHLDDTEDTESLLQSIVNDADRMAGIRDLRERLLGETSMTEITMESSEHEIDKDAKEAIKDITTSHYNSQVRKTEDNSHNLQPKDVDETLLNIDTLSPYESATNTSNKKDNLKNEMHVAVEEFDKHFSNLNTENDFSTSNNNGAENIDTDTKDKEQEPSDRKHFQDREFKSQTDELICITSHTGSKENYLVSVGEMKAAEENSLKALSIELVETNKTEGLPDQNSITDNNLSLIIESSNTEIESVIEESGDKSSEGLDEAYEASSDASEDSAPRTRRRSRSLRKLCAHQELQQASDSDSSPVRAACWKASAIDSSNCPRPKRKRSQSCSLESMSPTLEAHNRMQTLENSVSRTFIIEKKYSFNNTFTVEAEKKSDPEASTTPMDTDFHSNEEELLMATHENRQNVKSAESDEVVSVRSIKLRPSEDVPEPYKSESDLLYGCQKSVSQDTPLSSVKIVLNEATETDATESQNREVLNVLTLGERSISLSSNTTLTESLNEPSRSCKINSDDASQVELASLSEDVVPSEVKDAASEFCTSHNEGETTFSKSAILSNENVCKSQDCEIIKGHNLLPQGENQNSLSYKGKENGEPHPETVRMEEHETNTNDNVGSAQDMENGTKHEEIRRENHQSEKSTDGNLNQKMDEKFYEGEEVEVLSTSGIEEEDEGETVGMTPEAFGDNSEVEARKVGLIVSKKSLRSHRTKDGKNVNNDSESKNGRLAQIPVVKAQCLSKVALTKEVLISPDVSDEECELVSPGVDQEQHLTVVKYPIEVSNLENSTSHKNASICVSDQNLQKRNGGINSPHKTIPEEQDESTIPKNSPEQLPSLSIPSTEKLGDRNICTRQSSQGVTGEGPSGSPQNLEMPKSTKSNIKSPKALNTIQKEHTDTSDPEIILDTSNKSGVENKGQKRKETVPDMPKDPRSLTGSALTLSYDIDKVKKLQTNSPNKSDLTENKSNSSTSASQEIILLSPLNQNFEPLYENLDEHNSERCDVRKSLPTKNSVPDPLEENTVLRKNKKAVRNHHSSHSEEESSDCNTLPQSVTKPHKRSSSSSSSRSQDLLPVRRSSRLKKQTTEPLLD